jgi:casein kinase II subunit beta
MDTSQPEVPEDELLSATGEGDEVMEEVEEQEGYSACLHTCPSAYCIYFEYYLPSILSTVLCDPSRP